MPPTRTRTPLALKLALVPLVAGALIGGVWVTGAELTNDFKLAMALTVAWVVLVGLACVAVAVKRRTLAIPVLGAYLLAAGATGIYLGRSLLFDRTVNENVVTAAEPAPAAGRSHERPPARRNVQLAQGSFQSVAHAASGTATTIRRAGGGRVLTLTGFEVANGPDLRVYLVAGPARDESEVRVFRDLGALKGNKGNQQYDIPAGLDLRRYTTAVIWCRAFSVDFARAPLRRSG